MMMTSIAASTSRQLNRSSDVRAKLQSSSNACQLRLPQSRPCGQQ